MKEEFEENLPGAGGRTRRSEPIPLSPPYHPCNDHSANEEDGVASSKWLQSCRRDKMRTVGCPRHGLSRGGGREFSSNINFRIYYNLALFFSRVKLQLLPKNPERESYLIESQQIDCFQNNGIDSSDLHAVLLWGQILCLTCSSLYLWLLVQFLGQSPYFESLL